MARQKIVTLLTCLGLSAFPSGATAQQTRPDASELSDAQRDELGRLFNRAQTAYEAKNYLEAIEALRAAHELFPEPNILYRIGDAYENLGDLAKAAEYYRRYVQGAPDATDAGLVRRRIDDLERRAATLAKELETTAPERAALLLDTNPAGARVRLDDLAVEGETPLRVELAPGMHRVELQRDGHLPVVREIRIDAGETISLVYQLEREAVAPPPPTPSAAPWVIGGLGATALLASGGLFIGYASANQKISQWDATREKQFDAGETVDPRPDGYDSTVTQRAIFRNAAIVSGGIGAAALITGVVWLIARGGGEEVAFHPRAGGLAFEF